MFTLNLDRLPWIIRNIYATSNEDGEKELSVLLEALFLEPKDRLMYCNKNI